MFWIFIQKVLARSIPWYALWNLDWCKGLVRRGHEVLNHTSHAVTPLRELLVVWPHQLSVPTLVQPESEP